MKKFISFILDVVLLVFVGVLLVHLYLRKADDPNQPKITCPFCSEEVNLFSVHCYDCGVSHLLKELE